MTDNQSVSEFIIEFDVELNEELSEDLLAVIIIGALNEKFSSIQARLLEIVDNQQLNQDSSMKVKHYAKRQQQMRSNYYRTQDEGMYKKGFNPQTE